MVKNAAKTAIKGKKAIIKDANTMYAFLSNHMTIQNKEGEHKHSLRKFLFIGKEKIRHTALPRHIRYIPGTQLLHFVRVLACHCEEYAIDGLNTDNCLNKDKVDSWKEVVLGKKISLECREIEIRKALRAYKEPDPTPCEKVDENAVKAVVN